ncbi:hypothetical protein ABPG74_019059 [Tetrahymena malaccensis]
MVKTNKRQKVVIIEEYELLFQIIKSQNKQSLESFSCFSQNIYYLLQHYGYNIIKIIYPTSGQKHRCQFGLKISSNQGIDILKLSGKRNNYGKKILKSSLEIQIYIQDMHDQPLDDLGYQELYCISQQSDDTKVLILLINVDAQQTYDSNNDRDFQIIKNWFVGDYWQNNQACVSTKQFYIPQQQIQINISGIGQLIQYDYQILTYSSSQDTVIKVKGKTDDNSAINDSNQSLLTDMTSFPVSCRFSNYVHNITGSGILNKPTRSLNLTIQNDSGLIKAIFNIKFVFSGYLCNQEGCLYCENNDKFNCKPDGCDVGFFLTFENMFIPNRNFCKRICPDGGTLLKSVIPTAYKCITCIQNCQICSDFNHCDQCMPGCTGPSDCSNCQSGYGYNSQAAQCQIQGFTNLCLFLHTNM